MWKYLVTYTKHEGKLNFSNPKSSVVHFTLLIYANIFY